MFRNPDLGELTSNHISVPRPTLPGESSFILRGRIWGAEVLAIGLFACATAKKRVINLLR